MSPLTYAEFYDTCAGVYNPNRNRTVERRDAVLDLIAQECSNAYTSMDDYSFTNTIRGQWY